MGQEDHPPKRNDEWGDDDEDSLPLLPLAPSFSPPLSRKRLSRLPLPTLSSSSSRLDTLAVTIMELLGPKHAYSPSFLKLLLVKGKASLDTQVGR